MELQACTFFGHRDCPASVKPKLRAVLVELIEQKNVTRFYVGNQGSFDAMAYSVLQELSAHYPQIRCTVVLAYLPAAGEAPLPNSILPEGIETVPRRFCILWRNRWMLEHADYVVTYIVHPQGGAARFAQLAEKKQKAVYNLFG